MSVALVLFVVAIAAAITWSLLNDHRLLTVVLISILCLSTAMLAWMFASLKHQLIDESARTFIKQMNRVMEIAPDEGRAELRVVLNDLQSDVHVLHALSRSNLRLKKIERDAEIRRSIERRDRLNAE